MKLLQLINLIRPKHWLKNALVFAALFFSFSFKHDTFILTLLTFCAFCLIASSIYIFNDIYDSTSDRLHPEKKNRPIASGKVNIQEALITFFVLAVLGLMLALFVNLSIFTICIIYIVINIFYSLGLKDIAILDVTIVALGFVLRVVAGGLAIGVAISHWILLCTFFISLFLAFGKRKNEMDTLNANRQGHRESIKEYTDGFINQMLGVTSAISVVFYSLYTIDTRTVNNFGSDNLIYTTPIVVFGVLRYFHLIYNRNKGGDPVQLFLKDKHLIFSFATWVLLIIIIYYGHPSRLFK